MRALQTAATRKRRHKQKTQVYVREREAHFNGEHTRFLESLLRIPWRRPARRFR